MYTQHFGLKENPFALSPDPRYLFLSARHQDALAHLLYGINSGGGFVQLTGEVGTGKTLLIRAMLTQLPETVDVALVLYPFLSVREFMLALFDDLHIPSPDNDGLKSQIDTLNAFLLENHARGRRTVLIVDEAQRLNREVMEQIRLLTNLETTKEKLLQIILVGQPELNHMLARPDLRQLAQRVTARYNLQPLRRAETQEYVRHRCQVAGAESKLFTTPALAAVHGLTGGVPRLINILCDRALLAAFAHHRSQVKLGPVLVAAREVATEGGRRRRRVVAGSLLTLLVIAVLGAGLWQVQPGTSGLLPPAPTKSGLERVSDTRSDPAAQRHASSSMTVAQILVDPAIATDTETAFAGLFAQWNLDYRQFPGSNGCERAGQAGLRCLVESGTWSNLRLLNRPAIIEILDDRGGRHHLLVVKLSDDRATLLMSGRQIDVSLAELDKVWYGKYLALWNPPAFGEKLIGPGVRGEPVRWVRDCLQRYGLQAEGTIEPDQFDAALVRQVKIFQRRHLLDEDGLVGTLTLVYLSRYASSAVAPMLTASVR